MSYFPVLTAPNCLGVNTVYNFAPNNWEEGRKISKYLNVSYTNGTKWINKCLGSVGYGESVSLTQEALECLLGYDCSSTTFFLALSDKKTEYISDNLPAVDLCKTYFPAWRASLALVAATGAITSYQGEIDPFPAPGSLLTFGYLIQVSKNIKNYLLFINLERAATVRKEFLEVRDAKQPSILLSTHEVINNRVNIVPLDNHGMTSSSLLLLVCEKMAGIPLFLSATQDFKALSLEHTHSPASLVTYGDRFRAQKFVKNFWFSKI